MSKTTIRLPSARDYGFLLYRRPSRLALYRGGAVPDGRPLSEREPRCVYAGSMKEAQKALDESYPNKYLATSRRRVVSLYVTGIILGAVGGFTAASILWGLSLVA